MLYNLCVDVVCFNSCENLFRVSM